MISALKLFLIPPTGHHLPLSISVAISLGQINNISYLDDYKGLLIVPT